MLADDSGIEAAALGGRPGVRSASFAGENATDADILAALLAALAGAGDRRVRYVAELVAIAPDGRELHARGELRGMLAASAPGRRRVRYDPAFVPDGEQRTVADTKRRERKTPYRIAPARPEALRAQLSPWPARRCPPRSTRLRC